MNSILAKWKKMPVTYDCSTSTYFSSSMKFASSACSITSDMLKDELGGLGLAQCFQYSFWGCPAITIVQHQDEKLYGCIFVNGILNLCVHIFRNDCNFILPTIYFVMRQQSMLECRAKDTVSFFHCAASTPLYLLARLVNSILALMKKRMFVTFSYSTSTYFPHL